MSDYSTRLGGYLVTGAALVSCLTFGPDRVTTHLCVAGCNGSSKPNRVSGTNESRCLDEYGMDEAMQ